MARDPNVTERLRRLITQINNLTKSGELHWEREAGSAHRYARWKNNLLIVGPADPISSTKVPRYLFITPFDSPNCVEINSNDEELGDMLKHLVAIVEKASKREPPTDPFALSDDILSRLMD
ncbi:MAG TPA: hypothetical protein VK208_07280 [Pyrinomonadaceae bacterium]|jgi:hypothetical protein|nr:hypothetical protein [Pyrinomonadaceae bacterium]